ncbi:hypothetical protein G6F57_006530 [Rhizopus arrhizus]|uniref:Phosphatidylglycerol/phosphatidylinositol transfer protein n=1 Tax=Rhizopus oryzae TaxID=64495 RepID=A0A9P6WZU3_RHIOR|nr:hypothetical protein G6F23_007116 [Rhizopus arrhizus]KAG1411701.1 hypothetical protein G6F58_008420 [Rhizopus delemar]KAG0757137.1 hypothetical protein G6F24_010682 [Rhizopus arrhizus]KAG0790160.1 hypothetical protein G6F21_006012 [Rhizopus arrhizus]KAG0800867.1 hypothetical protein G6F22_001800 [Rhizopus arrhizus]
MGDSTKLITKCDKQPDLLTIEYIRLNPEVPVKGKNLEIEFKGYLSEQVPEGTQVEIVVKLGLVQLLKRKFDFCDKIQEIDEKCPIPEGEVTFHKEVELPNQIRKLYLYNNHTFSFTPFFSSLTLNATIAPGKYTVRAEIVTPENKRVTCLVGTTIFPRR